VEDHEILGVRPGATTTELKAAFRGLARTHPDQNPDDPTAAESFRRIRGAYERLLRIAARIPLSVPLATQVDGGVLTFSLSGLSHTVAVPARTPLDTVLSATREDGATFEVFLRPEAPAGWEIEKTMPGVLVAEILGTWALGYAGGTKRVVFPSGEERVVTVAPGTDTGSYLVLPAEGFYTSQGRMPALLRMRLIMPPIGSRRLAEALGDPWA
jgi:hypothetical protein